MKKELWERALKALPLTPRRIAYKRKRTTKGQLVESFKKGGKPNMPKIETEVREGADDVNEGVAYEIINVEEVTTDVQSLSGIRVSLKDKKGEEGNVMLWKRKVTGTASKLGAYISSLGDNTDKWLHKWVVHEPWQLRNNILTVVAAPTTKAKPAPKEKTT